MKHLQLTIIFSFFCIFLVQGQIDSEVHSGKQGSLDFELKNKNFFKNNEYYSPVTEGYTLIGYFFQPSLVYSPADKLHVTAGVHLLGYAGTGGFTTVKPVFSTRYFFSENTSLTIGTLEGSDRHQLFDPHFNFEKGYNEYSEDGLQFLSEGINYFNDTWISWEHFIFKGDTTREIFTFGESYRYKTPVAAGIMNAEFPVQLLARHRGGQISNYEEKVETFFNLAAGTRVNFFPENSRYGKIGIEYLKFISSKAPAGQMALDKGQADWYRIHYSYKALSGMAGYWQSNDFYAPHGNAIFSSLSDYQENVVVHDRKILTTSILVNTFPVEGLELFLGLDLYYDFTEKRMDNALTLHLSVDKLIHLLDIR